MIQIGTAYIGDSGGGVLDVGGQGTGDALIVLGSGVQFKDPLFLIGRDNNFQQYDLGFIGQRFQAPTAVNYNVGVIWDESAEEFAIAKVSETGTTNGNTTIHGYAPIRMGNAFIQGAVGINTSNPTQALDVIGGVDADDFFVNGVSIVGNTGAAVTILNAGSGSGIYHKIGAANYFKSLFPGNNISITESGSGLAINATTVSETFLSTGSQVDIFIDSGVNNYFRTLYADSGITITESGGALRIKNVAQDRSTYNGGDGSGIFYSSGDGNYFKSLVKGNYVEISDYGSSDSLELSITGLGTAATLNSGDFLQSSNDLSDLSSSSTARTNLGLGTAATKNSGDFLQVVNDLSDLSSASIARTNLGLGTVSTFNSGIFSQVANNLSDLSDTATARTNLGLGTIATFNSGIFAQVSNNLSDLSSASTARTNLGLGSAAVMNSGVNSGELIVLEGGAKLPAVDGSQLTGLGIQSTIDANTRGTDHPHMGAFPNQPFDTVDNQDLSAFLFIKNGNLFINNSTESVAPAVGLSVKEDAVEPDLEIEFTDGTRYSVGSLDSDVLTANGYPFRQEYKEAALGANAAPAYIDGGSF